MARILVVDDDSSLLQMVSLILKRAGHTPILATNGQEGIELAVNEQPDMAIVDIMMPDMSGYEVCRRLRMDSRTVETPLLILTALAQPEDRERAADAGADGYVTKPVTRDDLIATVDELLQTGARNIPSPLELMPEMPSDQPTRPAPPVRGQEAVAAPPSPAPQPAPAPPEVTTLPLVAVMGLHGGVGTTTVAVNLGLGLMQHGRACIVDLNSLAGQVAVQLRLSPDVTWHDIVDLPPSADKRRIGAIILRGHSSGVAVIAAPPRPVQERLSSLTLSYVFGVLAEAFRRIAVDLPDSLNAMSVTTLRHAAHIVLVVGDDPAGLATAPAALAALQDLGLTGTQHLVLNRSRPHGVSSQDVMQALRRPLAAELPYEPGQIAALNQGVPLVMSQPRSLYAQVILQLARAL